jgi:hypothetical protein
VTCHDRIARIFSPRRPTGRKKSHSARSNGWPSHGTPTSPRTRILTMELLCVICLIETDRLRRQARDNHKEGWESLIEQRRVCGLCRLIHHTPRIAVLDECTSAGAALPTTIIVRPLVGAVYRFVFALLCSRDMSLNDACSFPTLLENTLLVYSMVYNISSMLLFC